MDMQSQEPSSHNLNKIKDGERFDEMTCDPDQKTPNISGFNLDQTLKNPSLENPQRNVPVVENVSVDVKEDNNKRKKKKQKRISLDSFKCKQPTINCFTQFECLKKLTGSCECFKKLSTKGKVGVISLAIILTTAIILVGVLIHLLVPPPPQNMFLNPLDYNGTVVYSNVMEGTTKDNHRYSAHLTQWKASVSHPTLEAVTRTVRTSSNKQEIHCNIPILQIMDNFGATHKQQKAYEDWLDHYNSNPQETVNKLIETIKSTLSRPGTYKFGKRIPDNLTLLSVGVGNQIDVEYLPLEAKFVASQFDSNDVDTLKMEFETKEDRNSQTNLKKEYAKDVPKQDEKLSKDTPSKEEQTKKTESKQDTSKDTNKKVTPPPQNKTTQKSTEQKQNLMAKVMLETVYYIKRVVARNVQVLRAKSAQLVAYQKHLVEENSLEQDWQKALVDGCRTVESLRFRCSFEAAGALVPGLTMENIRASSDYLISQTLNLVFQQVKEITQ